MLPFSDGREASTGIGAPPYVRHRPERTFLYQLVEEYHPAFKAHLAAQGTDLPGYVEREFEDYLKCGRLEHGFLRVRCDSCHAEHLVAFSCKRRGLLRASCPAPFGPAFGCSKSFCRAPRFHCPPGGPGAETAGQPDALPRGLCAEQQVPPAGDAEQAE